MTAAFTSPDTPFLFPAPAPHKISVVFGGGWGSGDREDNNDANARTIKFSRIQGACTRFACNEQPITVPTSAQWHSGWTHDDRAERHLTDVRVVRIR